MNKVLIGMLMGCFFQWAGQAVHAQEMEHSVKFPKGNATWTVLFPMGKEKLEIKPSPNGEESTTTGERRLVRVEVVRMGETRRDWSHWSDGSRDETWWSLRVPVVLSKRPGGEVRALRAEWAADRRFDETLFSWVNRGTFKGLEEFQDKKCAVYRKEIMDLSGEPTVLTVWIDPATRQPVGWSDGGPPAVFVFGQALPEAAPVLPGEFREALAKSEAILAPKKRLGR